MNILISPRFRSMSLKAMLAIAFFIFVYLILIILGLAWTGACAVGAYFLVSLKPTFFTLMLGLGLLGAGVLILIFLVKFIFKKHKTDRSHLIEITRLEEPKLFYSLMKL